MRMFYPRWPIPRTFICWRQSFMHDASWCCTRTGNRKRWAGFSSVNSGLPLVNIGSGRDRWLVTCDYKFGFFFHHVTSCRHDFIMCLLLKLNDCIYVDNKTALKWNSCDCCKLFNKIAKSKTQQKCRQHAFLLITTSETSLISMCW